MLAAGLEILAGNNVLDEVQNMSVPAMDVGGSIQNVCKLALTGCCLSRWCHCKNIGITL